MTSIEVKEPIKNKQNLPSGQEQDLEEDSDKQQLIRTSGLKQESLMVFEQSVQRIYKQKMKISQLELQDKAMEISIKPADIQQIIYRVLIQVCQIHKALIGDQMRVMLQVDSGQYFYKIDGCTAGDGYYDNLSSEWNLNQNQGQQQQQIQKIYEKIDCQGQSVNKNYYNYCVWIIYHHYCSLSECNKQIYKLAKIFRQNSQNLFFHIYQQIENKKNINEQDLYQFDREFLPKLQPISEFQALSQIKRTTDLIQQYQIIRIDELNMLTITKLIPVAMPKLYTQIYENGEQNVSDLYCHIRQFQSAINSIINENKQNMRKYTLFLQEFRNAIRILRSRISKTKNLPKNQTDIMNEIRLQRQKLIRSELRRNSLFKQQQFIEEQIDKTMKQEIQLQKILGQYAKEKQKQLVLNLKQYTFNKNTSRQIRSQVQNKRRMQLKGCFLSNQNDYNRKKFQLTKRKIDFQLKNSKMLEKVDKLQSVTHISRKITENKIDSLKIEMIYKKNQKSQQVVKFLKNFHEDEQLSLENQNKSKSSQQKQFQLLQQIKIRSNLQKGVVEQLKNSINNLTTSAIERQIQFDNYIKSRKQKQNKKQNKKQSKKYKIRLYDEGQYAQMNFHQYLHESKFENQQEDSDGEDTAYLQKMQEQIEKNQKKKKKKKNKKKKQKKQDIGDLETYQQDNYSENSNIKVNQPAQSQNSVQCLLNQQEELIVKKLRNLRIDRQNRSLCYQIEDDCLYAMKHRQNSLLSRQINIPQIPTSKTKNKSKRTKIK